jgi:hypothetical protein
MGSQGGSIFGYLHTLPITPKSQSIPFNLLETSFTHIVGRVLLAGIRNLGNHPCPRCLIPLADASRSGMARDARRRQTLARKDTTNYRKNIIDARNYIHNRNYAVDSAPVKRLLDNESLIPSMVRFAVSSLIVLFELMFIARMHSPKYLPPWVSTCFLCLSLTSCTRWSWVHGDLSLSTYCASWKVQGLALSTNLINGDSTLYSYNIG